MSLIPLPRQLLIWKRGTYESSPILTEQYSQGKGDEKHLRICPLCPCGGGSHLVDGTGGDVWSHTCSISPCWHWSACDDKERKPCVCACVCLCVFPLCNLFPVTPVPVCVTAFSSHCDGSSNTVGLIVLQSFHLVRGTLRKQRKLGQENGRFVTLDPQNRVSRSQISSWYNTFHFLCWSGQCCLPKVLNMQWSGDFVLSWENVYILCSGRRLPLTVAHLQWEIYQRDSRPLSFQGFSSFDHIIFPSIALRPSNGAAYALLLRVSCQEAWSRERDVPP